MMKLLCKLLLCATITVGIVISANAETSYRDNLGDIAGDATGDGITDVEDVNAIINVILGILPNPEPKDYPYYDLTGDNKIDVGDVNRLINIILGSQEFSSKTYTVNGVSFTMVPVEGGTFTMGATAEQGKEAYDTEKPAHQVTLSNYSIGETEVTQALWVAVMGDNPSIFNDNPQRPVECVSWDDCQEFITKLNQLTGEQFRLPTEAEWEFAARGGNKSRGYKYAGSNNIEEVAWYCNNVPSLSGDSQPVATKAPNELGLYDMSGNVSEWCQDLWGSYSSEPQTNPTGPSSGYYCVVRGGCWFFYAQNCRVSYRQNGSPLIAADTLGLRLAL